MAIEPITFGKGMVRKKSPLLLEDGELYSVDGFCYEHEGCMEARTPKTAVNTTAVGSINLIHRYINWILLADAGTIRYKWDLDSYCDLYTPPNGDFTSLGSLSSANRPRVADYRDFSFIVNGSDKKAFTSGNLYEWGIDAPTSAPIGTAGSATGMTGTYTLYYTYFVMFPNGRTYETGLSPAGTVTVNNQKISWGGITTCPYSGTGLIKHRRLYRTNDTLGSIYYVTTISDNTTTTYTDSVADSTLEDNDVCATDTYMPPPSGFVDVTDYLQRVFGIKGSNLHYSEPYIPFAFPTSNMLTVSRDGEDLTGIIQWGDQLYIPSKNKWYRLLGSDSSTWSIKNTFAEQGCINRYTMKATRYGIVGLWYDGIYLFDGAVAKNISEAQVGKSYFDDISNKGACYAEFDGMRYFLHYPTSGTTLSKTLIVDFSYYPKLRFFEDSSFVPTAYEYHMPTGIKYYGKSDGYQYKEDSSGTNTIPTSVQTGDRALSNVNKLKNCRALYYDINTNGQNVTLTVYEDGTASSTTYTINTSSRTRKRLPLANHEAYRISLSLSCADSQDLHIYEPWALDYTVVGGE